MVDFTSALYLGHSPLSSPFPQHLSVTTGKPAALYEPRLHQVVAQEVARRQGLERGILAPSTLHIFWDIVSLLNQSNVVLVDESIYPLGRWGIMRALFKKVPVATFRANNLEQLGRLVYTHKQQNRIPWIVTDGWNMERAQPAPLAQYLEILKDCRESILLVDDTQAFGILGHRAATGTPYGCGGGGCMPYLGLQSSKLLTVTSLAKGLGVPVAVLAGNPERINQFRQRSDVRVHTSPVSNLHAWAAWQALQTDQQNGDDRRNRLYQNVTLFQRMLRAVGTSGGFFPVQKLKLVHTATVLTLYHSLKARGIYSLLLASKQPLPVPELAFCLRADHTTEAIMYTCRQIDSIYQDSNRIDQKARKTIYHESLVNF